MRVAAVCADMFVGDFGSVVLAGYGSDTLKGGFLRNA